MILIDIHTRINRASLNIYDGWQYMCGGNYLLLYDLATVDKLFTKSIKLSTSPQIVIEIKKK